MQKNHFLLLKNLKIPQVPALLYTYLLILSERMCVCVSRAFDVTFLHD